MVSNAVVSGEVPVEGMGEMKDTPPEKNPGLTGSYTTTLLLKGSYSASAAHEPVQELDLADLES